MSNLKKRHPTKWTTSSFQQAIQSISPDIIVTGEYTNLANCIECKCLNCQTTWNPIAGNLIRGTKCPNCSKKNRQKKNKIGTERQKWNKDSFTKRIYEIDSNIELVGDYVNTASKIQCRCKRCGAEWFPTANNLLMGRSHCPTCSKKSAAKKSGMTQEDFLQRVYEIDDTIEVLGEYRGTKKHILCRCKKCGNTWSPSGDSLLQGKGCRACSYTENGEKFTFSQIEFEEKLRLINPNVIILGEYKGTYQRIECRCSVCNHEWNAIPHYLLTGRGCPNCFHTSTSYIEQFLLQSFRKVFGKSKVLSRDKSAIGMELDIYIPSLKFAIEPGSWRFHKEKLSNDQKKQLLCKNAGIHLITVYYNYDDEIINNQDIVTYKKDLALPSESSKLIALTTNLLNMVSVNVDFSDEEWREISSIAYIHSRKLTTEQFVERLKTITNTIEVIGEYKRSTTKVLCRCLICNNTWNVTPNDLLSGRGCPQCAIKRNGSKRKLSQREFEQKAITNNKNIQILGDYQGNKYRIDCKCLKCGYQWAPVAGQLVSKRPSGCPRCAGKIQMTSNDFKELMKIINPEIEILSDYTNTETKVECHCLKCNRHWFTTPHTLKSGHGCPSCSKRKPHKKA